MWLCLLEWVCGRWHVCYGSVLSIIIEMVGDDSLNISVDLSGDDGIKYHTLRITVRVVYRGAFATLPYYFKFKKEDSTEVSQ